MPPRLGSELGLWQGLYVCASPKAVSPWFGLGSDAHLIERFPSYDGDVNRFRTHEGEWVSKIVGTSGLGSQADLEWALFFRRRGFERGYAPEPRRSTEGMDYGLFMGDLAVPSDNPPRGTKQMVLVDRYVPKIAWQLHRMRDAEKAGASLGFALADMTWSSRNYWVAEVGERDRDLPTAPTEHRSRFDDSCLWGRWWSDRVPLNVLLTSDMKVMFIDVELHQDGDIEGQLTASLTGFAPSSKSTASTVVYGAGCKEAFFAAVRDTFLDNTPQFFKVRMASLFDSVYALPEMRLSSLPPRQVSPSGPGSLSE